MFSFALPDIGTSHRQNGLEIEKTRLEVLKKELEDAEKELEKYQELKEKIVLEHEDCFYLETGYMLATRKISELETKIAVLHQEIINTGYKIRKIS